MDTKFFLETLSLVFLLLLNETNSASASQGCGSVVNNTLKSPGYPYANYPKIMDCIYLVPIPYGMVMNISFFDFYMVDDSSCE